jgi:hypothetical protein
LEKYWKILETIFGKFLENFWKFLEKYWKIFAGEMQPSTKCLRFYVKICVIWRVSPERADVLHHKRSRSHQPTPDFVTLSLFSGEGPCRAVSSITRPPRRLLGAGNVRSEMNFLWGQTCGPIGSRCAPRRTFQLQMADLNFIS